MPGFLHDGVVTLLEQHPELLLDAWCRASGSDELLDAAPVVLSNELRLTFAAQSVRHLQPDLVVRFDRPRRRPRFGTVEVVATRAPRRGATWQTHAVLLEQRFGERDPVQLVIPLGPAITRWVTRQIRGRVGINALRVLGPAALPRIDSLDAARADPYRAALAIAVLRERATLPSCEAALQALLELTDPLAGDYARMILTAVPDPGMKEELLMSLRARVIEIDAADRQGYLYRVAFADGRQEGRIATLTRVLETRGLAPTPSLVERLRECTEEQLDRATLLALTAPTPAEFERLLFGSSSGLDG